MTRARSRRTARRKIKRLIRKTLKIVCAVWDFIARHPAMLAMPLIIFLLVLTIQMHEFEKQVQAWDQEIRQQQEQIEELYDRQDPAMSSLLPVLQILEHMQGGRRVNRRYARRSEDTEQMSVMDWARWNQNAHPELELLHHCPNGGSRNKAEAVKMKQMGVKAGIPDLCLPVPMGMYNGLYIEMKYDTGRLEDSQKKMLKALAAAGHYCTVCYGAEEAIRVLQEYINLKKIDTGNREDEMSEQNLMIRKNGKVKCIIFKE